MSTSTPVALPPETLLAAFQALSDANRLRIVDILRDGERCVCKLVDALEMAQPLLSHHLRALKDAGLVRDRRDGRWVHYALVPEALEAMSAFLENVRREAESAEPDPLHCS